MRGVVKGRGKIGEAVAGQGKMGAAEGTTVVAIAGQGTA